MYNVTANKYAFEFELVISRYAPKLKAAATYNEYVKEVGTDSMGIPHLDALAHLAYLAHINKGE